MKEYSNEVLLIVNTATKCGFTPQYEELEKLYEKFNINHPADFRGHSLSVSDIVALKRDGVVSCHYCDSVGFKEVPEFMQEQEKNRLEHTEKCVEHKKRTEKER